MDSAASALRYWERKQEVVANNLANVSTGGFKSQRMFARLMSGVLPTPETSSDLSTGSLTQTSNPLDLAVDGSGFLVVSTPDGDRYSRGGSLRLDEKHQLVDTDGRPVLGIKGPITLSDDPVEIDHDGTVKQNGQLVDQLRLESPPAGTEPQREGNSLWVPAPNAQVIKPEARTIKQGYLEDSNVNSTSALVDMVAVQRAYSSVQKAVVTMDQMDQTVTTQIAKPL